MRCPLGSALALPRFLAPVPAALVAEAEQRRADLADAGHTEDAKVRLQFPGARPGIGGSADRCRSGRAGPSGRRSAW